ncbi:MAG: tripartite tricarboxylate transporter TctB family protein [Desulfobacterota bacterium]|nr:tripartite tricarboxylate transporter TctB family protein [Thermodesulfobacteriota bacterium]
MDFIDIDAPSEFNLQYRHLTGEVSTIEKWDRLTGAVLFVIGVVTALSSVGLKMGSLRHPGSGFLPFSLSIALIVLSAILILTRLGKGKGSKPFWPERTWLRPLLAVLILFSYALAIGRLGFPLTTFLFLLAWMKVIEQLGWFRVIGLSFAVTASLYLIFGKLLEVPLPMGFFSG